MENAIILAVGFMCFIGVLAVADLIHSVYTNHQERKFHKRVNAKVWR
jgi:hypothetical protein